MDINRYSRQILFEQINKAGQQRLSESTVLIVGIGALGTVISNQLVRAGVGKVRIVDRDVVEISNLQRQILFDEEDAEKSLPKAIAAKRKLERVNSMVEIEAIIGNASRDNIDELTEGVDVVLDGTDNFATRYLLNDICFKKNIPYSYGGVVSSRGMTAFFVPKQTPCLRCLSKEGSDGNQTCDTVGVISPVVDMVSSLQVTETLKYLTNRGEYLRNTLRSFDIWFNQQYDIKLNKPDPNCPTCQLNQYPALQKKAKEEEIVLCGRNTVQIHLLNHVSLEQLESKFSGIQSLKRTPFFLKVTIDEQISLTIFTDGRVLVQGTEDQVYARTVYDRYIGS
ncbi:ThiF family adenylyltransferase [Virgibacillus halodenitrificans]|uniref:Thiamine biosynthesis protein ThiF n=1 Tax=Virgibacillus halodenitrificans TaxID=1482 RepID=A0AAC9J0E6_VIRHA|nr:ThiF family adenylyltransferase [Virgibacillus halodenitrificans]APC48252.1 thiamine biosynthesis protein ThiF [Virgibacillus halodenitrificans]MCJ0930859.1 ThiF family adenylyltransferase [Virgibacillus halodenitrificans]MYL47168.1 thiazole biosynthesis adenylyltransferase ThiF [Virgibacillus halodenitrificans]MYL58874.1 thiazole biosynthesis adenylyltransferase ThiF [Virgibacillus halodenitrificans]